MELELVYNEETQEWEQRAEPFITIECETEEDFEFIGTAIAFYQKHLEKQEKPMTNADRIRSLTDEELVEEILRLSLEYDPWCDYHCKMDGHDDDCNRCLRRWLQQPAEEE